MGGNQNIEIFGAGMSGLIAAIDLAKNGYHVTVYDKEPGFGGDSVYNPSTHTTPLDVETTSQYTGIDISPVFYPLLECPIYFHDTRINAPVGGVYSVERGNRPSSLDTLLYNEARKHNIDFKFKTPLKKEDIKNIEPGTIIACGLTPDVYRMLDIPYLTSYGWASRGECDFSNKSWIWIDECITEYGYLSSANNYYFNLLFSTSPVKKEDLQKYKDFMKRVTGMEHHDWIYAPAAVPVKSAGNPRLFHKNFILCGTIAGFIDPKFWFGIAGALVSGKIAALAVYNREKAERDFTIFNRYFKRGYFLKKYIWSKLIRPRVGMMERFVKKIGIDKIEKIGNKMINAERHNPGSIPGFANLGATRTIPR